MLMSFRKFSRKLACATGDTANILAMSVGVAMGAMRPLAPSGPNTSTAGW